MVDGKISMYRDPSSGSRSGAAAVSAAVSVITPVLFVASTNPSVSATIDVIRTTDAKKIGYWPAMKKGGNFTKCTSLTAEIADTIYEKQFSGDK